MADAEPILVDTSVWIKFFRFSNSSEAVALDGLLSLGMVVTCDPIRAEVISGAPTQAEFNRLRDLFGTLKVLEPPANLWPRLEACRFTLARRGHQASLVDLMIAITAQAHQAVLWTLDGDFKSITSVIPVRLYQSPLVS